MKPSLCSHARSARRAPATRQLLKRNLDRLGKLRANFVKAEGDAFKDYWLTQIDVHHEMVSAWIAHAQGSRKRLCRCCGRPLIVRMLSKGIP